MLYSEDHSEDGSDPIVALYSEESSDPYSEPYSDHSSSSVVVRELVTLSSE